MSPAPRSKSKDEKSGKEISKGSSKPSSHANTTSGSPPGGYNPLLGTFHTFETTSVPSASAINGNGRFRNIDDTDDHNGNTSGTGIDYDSGSNNGSWSGESEDHKEKPSQPLPHQESVPGADNEKREKIRQKNERKHQRQKERRAQELHERCCGYLMSRKLEGLAQQLVAMGFPQERATMALILNEGRVEDSVAWLLEGSEGDKHVEPNLNGWGNLKIDISDELARITDMEIRYMASKKVVERAVVSYEGDLEKAEETLRSQKEEPPAAPSKPEESGDTPTVANSKQPMAISQNPLRMQVNSVPSTVMQQKREEKDFKYDKVTAAVGSSVDPGTKSAQVSKKMPPKLDWAKPQHIAVPAEKRWASAASNSSRFSSSSLQPSPLQATTEAYHVTVGNELRKLQLGSLKEPVTVMQRPQIMNAKLAPTTSLSSSPPGVAMGWYPNSVETVKPHGFVPPVAVSRNLGPNILSSNPINKQLHFEPQQQFVSTSSSMNSLGTRGNGCWSRGASPALAVASSLGLFSGMGANGMSGSSSLVDWSTGSSLPCDYTNIDWSLDRGSLSSRSNGLWTDATYSMQNRARTYDSFSLGQSGAKPNMRPVLSNGTGAAIPAMQDRVASLVPTTGGSWEWSSPFEEKDIFNVPRQFVSSPSL